MSCKECDTFQDSGNKIFYRWKTANVEINACKKHVLEIFEVLNAAQAVRRKEEYGKRK